MGDKILEVENLTKSYDKSKLVLNNLSFSLEKGEVVVIVGPSGCGKSTPSEESNVVKVLF